MDLGLAGKNAVITGSTRGIGRAIANLLADEGTNLAICSRNQEEVDSAVAELSAKGVKVTGAVVDVADKASYQAWIASVGEELGGIDIFVPNVSAGDPVDVVLTAWDSLGNVVDTDFFITGYGDLPDGSALELPWRS